MQYIAITELAPVVAKHEFRRSIAAEKGGEGAEAGISQELTPEGDSNA